MVVFRISRDIKGKVYLKSNKMKQVIKQEIEYCPEGHFWIPVHSTTLYSEYYYCEDCDKIYQLQPVEIKEEDIKINFNSDRYKEMKKYAKSLRAKEKISYNDLIILGYL